MHIIGHPLRTGLPALPIRRKQAARADRFPPYMTAKMGNAVVCEWVAQGTGRWGSRLLLTVRCSP
jgi:hypothetical protein